jgi:hypothetical protein
MALMGCVGLVGGGQMLAVNLSQQCQALGYGRPDIPVTLAVGESVIKC